MQTKSKLVIGFVGKICSGKGVATDYIKKKYKADTVMFSQSMRDILSRIYLPIERDKLQRLSSALRQEFGQDLFSKTVVNDIRHSKKNIVAIDGIRRPFDIQDLKKLPGFVLVHLTTPPDERHVRLRKRNQNSGDNKITWQKFLKQDSAEAEKNIDLVAKKAKYKIENIGTLKDLYKKIDEIIKMEK